jgi:cell division protein FtsB
MSDAVSSEPKTASVAEAEKQDQATSTGESLLSLLRQSSELAGGNGRYAVQIARKLSDQLLASQKRVAELQARVADLEAEVQIYRDKSTRAEAWLGKISSEIQERVLGSSN